TALMAAIRNASVRYFPGTPVPVDGQRLHRERDVPATGDLLLRIQSIYDDRRREPLRAQQQRAHPRGGVASRATGDVRRGGAGSGKAVNTLRGLTRVISVALLLSVGPPGLSAQTAGDEPHCFSIRVRLNGKTVDGPEVVTLKT